jgi:hypothetical protein
MTKLVKRLAIDALLAYLFYRFSRVVFVVVLFFAAIFGYGVISSAWSDFRAHGGGEQIDPATAASFSYNTDVNNSQVNWTFRNTSDRVLGSVEIACVANGTETLFLAGDYVAPGQEVSGAKYNSTFGYDTRCHLADARLYDK